MTATTNCGYNRVAFLGALVALLVFAGAIRAQQSAELPPVPLAGEFNGDVRDLPPSKPRTAMPGRRLLKRRTLPESLRTKKSALSQAPFAESSVGPRAPMPATIRNFAGLTNNDNV